MVGTGKLQAVNDKLKQPGLRANQATGADCRQPGAAQRLRYWLKSILPADSTA